MRDNKQIEKWNKSRYGINKKSQYKPRVKTYREKLMEFFNYRNDFHFDIKFIDSVSKYGILQELFISDKDGFLTELIKQSNERIEELIEEENSFKFYIENLRGHFRSPLSPRLNFMSTISDYFPRNYYLSKDLIVVRDKLLKIKLDYFGANLPVNEEKVKKKVVKI
jgi:hypothetical protein